MWVVRKGMVVRKKKDCEGVLETIVLKGEGSFVHGRGAGDDGGCLLSS